MATQRIGGVVSVHVTGGLCPIPAHFGAIMLETFGESTPPSPMAGASVQRRKAKQTPETDIQQRPRRRARQSREYELIWLLQQRLPAVLASLALALHAATVLSHGMGLVRP